jgi:hypothetical protein
MAVSAIAIAFRAGFRAARAREAPGKLPEPEPAPAPDDSPSRGPEDGSSGESSSGIARTRRIPLPPQWLIFLAIAVVLAFKGFELLPPDQSQNISGERSPEIAISVSRPGVQLLAVLDGSRSDDGVLFIDLYADGVAGGFKWRIESSEDDLSPTDEVGPRGSDGQWTDEVTGQVGSSNSAQYSVLTNQDATPDMQKALREGTYATTAGRGVIGDDSDRVLAGANLQVKLPTLEFDGSRTSQSFDGWYAPTGEVAVLAPDEINTYQTEIADPPFSSQGMWVDTSQVYGAYWSGTDPALQAQANQNLFTAGLLFGIAGSALIASLQDIVLRYRAWRDKSSEDD